MTQDLKVTTGIVQKNVQIAESVYEMAVETEICKDFIPGQFINVYLDDKSMLLPRPISICDADNSGVRIVYKIVGRGTKHLSAYRMNQEIKISSPLGNGYHVADDATDKRIALVAGGIGSPPMLGLVKKLTKQNADVSVFLGFPSQPFLVDEWKGLCEKVFIATDDGSFGFHGNVLELLRQSGEIYDEYFSCGPKGMLKAISEYLSSIERNMQVSLEERMGCGYGACLGCSCKIRENGAVTRKSVCKHGPVFLGKDVVWDE